MLTILVVYPDGTELVKEVDSVMRRNGVESESGAACITFWTKDEVRDIFDGKVFVMNDNGKTVATYVVSSKWKETK